LELIKKLFRIITIKDPHFLYFRYDEWKKIRYILPIILYFNKNYKKCLIFKKKYKNNSDIVIVGLRWYGKNVKRRTNGLAKEYLHQGKYKKCMYCSTELTHENATIDHIIPISNGGSNAQVNLIVCCRDCNSERGDTNFYQYLKTKRPVLDKEKIIWI